MRRSKAVWARLPLLALALLCSTASCREASRPTAGAPKASVLPPLPPAPRDPYAPTSEGTPPPLSPDDVPRLTAVDRPAHVRAIADAKSGRLHEAKRRLGRLAIAYPTERVLIDQYNAVVAQIEARQQHAKVSLEAATLRNLPVPPAKYELVRAAPTSGAVPKLVKTSEKKNEIVDEEAWFTKNRVSLPVFFIPPVGDILFAPGAISSATVINTLAHFSYTEYTPSSRFREGPMPLEIPLSYGTLPLVRAIDSSPHLIAIYGATVLALFDATHDVVGLFDFTSYVHPPASTNSTHKVGEATLTTASGSVKNDITVDVQSISHELQFALARDGVLYVSHGNGSYAKENRGQNAYVTALDSASGEMLWRTAPLVSNVHAFALVGGGLVTGYGFSAEPDFLYVLDRATGKSKQTLPVPSGPDYILVNDDKVFVRTYDADLVFRVK
jgi:hypothetical protein